MANARQGADTLRRIADRLEASDGLAEAFADGVLRIAVQNAAGRPTPQAPMAAAAMGVRGSTITVLSGGVPLEVSAGSEWGSNIYRQFGPRNESGWWLFPAAESSQAQQAGDAYLEQMMDTEIRRGSL